jgi:hypothetical protein
MSIEGEEGGGFAEFEAAVIAGEPAPEVVAEPKAAEPTGDEPLELTDADEAVDLADGEEGGEKDPDDKRRRSKPAAHRIAELTARLRETERERDALKTPPAAEPAKAPDKPDPAKFEFGEADPSYIDALTDWKIDSREAERAKAGEANHARQQFVDRITTGVSTAETSGKAKYADFEAKVTSAVERACG